jgi:putative flavoprotein involved in K+ transport
MDTVVIGAGPGGLATSRELKRRGIEHVVLERGDAPAHTWANLYDSWCCTPASTCRRCLA